jgi:hypothetical protein
MNARQRCQTDPWGTVHGQSARADGSPRSVLDVADRSDLGDLVGVLLVVVPARRPRAAAASGSGGCAGHVSRPGSV